MCIYVNSINPYLFTNVSFSTFTCVFYVLL